MKRLILLLILSLLVIASQSGCNLTLGPQTETRILIPHTATKTGRRLRACTIVDEREIRIMVRGKDGKMYVDKAVLQGFDAVAPEPPDD